MTNDEAEQMLRTLSTHYGCPVQPVTRYCQALRSWQEALEQKAERTKDPGDSKFAGMVASVFFEITKSNLLARLIYQGEQLRTKPCPVHDGVWSGCYFGDDICDCQRTQDGRVGLNVTGWLP